jgi:chromosome partitioning protein
MCATFSAAFLRSHFDLCVIDTGPKWDELTLSALAVADAVIAPVQVAEDSVECAKMLPRCARPRRRGQGARSISSDCYHRWSTRSTGAK